MTIKEDFYEIINVQDDSIIQDAINDGIKTYLEKLGFDTGVIAYNISIEMHVDSDKLKEYKDKSKGFLQCYCDLLTIEIDSSFTDKKIISEYKKELEVVTEFLDEYN